MTQKWKRIHAECWLTENPTSCILSILSKKSAIEKRYSVILLLVIVIFQVILKILTTERHRSDVATETERCWSSSPYLTSMILNASYVIRLTFIKVCHHIGRKMNHCMFLTFSDCLDLLDFMYIYSGIRLPSKCVNAFCIK